MEKLSLYNLVTKKAFSEALIWCIINLKIENPTLVTDETPAGSVFLLQKNCDFV